MPGAACFQPCPHQAAVRLPTRAARSACADSAHLLPVRREARCQAPTPHRASPRRPQCGTRHRKKDSTQMQQRCTLMHADRPEAGMVPHGRHRIANPGEPRRCGRPCPIRVPPRPSACICARPCLLRRGPLAAASGGTHVARGSQNPMHQFRPRFRRPGIVASRRNPMHQFGSTGCAGRDTAPARPNSHGPGARLAGQETRRCRDAGTLQVRHQRQNPMHLNDCSPRAGQILTQSPMRRR